MNPSIKAYCNYFDFVKGQNKPKQFNNAFNNERHVNPKA